jgi:SNF2 family DNA or RNA helicase
MFDTMHENLTKMGETFVGINGKTPMAERLPLIDTFLNEPKCKYALCTLGACSTGLNFTPASQMIFLELSWNISDILQGQCRINRIGGASKLYYTYLICEDTLDENVFKKIKAKNQNTIAILENGKDYGDMEFNVADDHSFKRKRDYGKDGNCKRTKHNT